MDRKKKLADELKVGKMEAKFSAHYDAVEVELKSSTVGLLTIEQVKLVRQLKPGFGSELVN
jgi:protein FAM50